MEGPTGADNLEVGNQSPKEDERIIEAGEQVRGLLRLMIDKMGIDIPDSEWPQVLLRLEGDKDSPEVSAYSPEDNIIYIHEPNLNSGITYGEEIGHFIREYLCKKNNREHPYENLTQGAIDEFFGRIGENLAREVSRGTNLEALFHEEERRHFKDETFLAKLKIDVAELRPKIDEVVSTVETGIASQLEILSRIKKFYAKVEEAENLCQEAKAQKSSSTDLAKKIARLLFYGEGGTDELFKFMGEDGGSHQDRVGSLNEIIGISNFQIESILKEARVTAGATQPEIYESFLDRLNTMKAFCDNQLFSLSGVNLNLLLVVIKLESQLYHIVGYSAAECYMSDNPDWLSSISSVYNLSDEEVASRFLEDDQIRAWFEGNEDLQELYNQIEKIKDLRDKAETPVDEEINFEEDDLD
ncbi:MAG: hypothetical protein WCV68_02820 [Candidatus Paceibacterota bacterium]|jgi:hypothetical protein